MFTGQIDTITNRADWTGPFCQIVDDSDGSIVNILNPSIGFDCSVYIEDEHGCQIVLGSIANGKVIAAAGDDGPGFQWSFVANDFSGLCAGTYRFIIKTTTNGEVNDLMVGSIAVLRGH